MSEEFIFNCLENYPVGDYVVPFDDIKLKV